MQRIIIKFIESTEQSAKQIEIFTKQMTVPYLQYKWQTYKVCLQNKWQNDNWSAKFNTWTVLIGKWKETK